MDKAIIHTETGVIRRITTDENPPIGKDESIVVLSTKVDLGGGYKKIDSGGDVILASLEEVDLAGVDEILVAKKIQAKKEALASALEEVINDQSVPLTLRTYYSLLK